MINEFLIGNTFFSTFGQGEFSPLLQNFSLALLTVLIPVSLAIFQTRDGEAFDRMVVVNKVLKLDDLFIAILLCFFPTILWVFFAGNWFQLLLFIIWTIGCQKLIGIYWINFRWLKGRQDDVKFEYIKSLKFTNNDFTTAYEYIWRTSDSLKYKEREYIDLFASTLENLIENKNYLIIEKLIDGFNLHLDKRTPTAVLISENLLKSFFNIHKISWQESHQLMGSDNIDLWGNIDEVNRKVEELINEVFLLGIKNKRSHFFMKKYQENINNNLGLSVTYDKGSYNYVEQTISSFTHVLFSEQIEREEARTFWNYEFPVEWKITKLGLTNSYSLVVIQIINDYIRWLGEEFHKDNEGFKVDNITLHLFPDIDPMVWLPLIDFSLHSFGESRVSSMIQRKWQFGLIGRIRTYTGKPSNEKAFNDFKNDREKTYELIYSLSYFGTIFSLSNLNKYLLELNKHKTQDNIQLRNKKWLISVFNEMKRYLKSQEKNEL
jgi:hypothetical protein